MCTSTRSLLLALCLLLDSGADVVEVAPAYDHAEITSLAAASIVSWFGVDVSKGRRDAVAFAIARRAGGTAKVTVDDDEPRALERPPPLEALTPYFSR